MIVFFVFWWGGGVGCRWAGGGGVCVISWPLGVQIVLSLTIIVCKLYCGGVCTLLPFAGRSRHFCFWIFAVRHMAVSYVFLGASN